MHQTSSTLLILTLVPTLGLVGGRLPGGSTPLAPAVWSGDGHRMVCEMALQRLTPPARAEVDRLIALDPEYSTFADACVWADDVRSRMRDEPALRRFARYTPSHYVNTPRGAPGVDPEACTERREGRAPRPCVVDAISEFADSLRDASSDDRRLEALKFLGHFVGDVHQPLHSGYGDDRGGNDTPVSIMGEAGHNLHEVWDAFFIEHQARPWTAYVADLAARIRPVDEAQWSSLDPLTWADESYQIVEDEVYAGVVDSGGYVGQRYFDRHIVTVERQLRKGAVRLALLLNSILDPGR